MAKRLNYQIGVTADTSQFESQIRSTFNSLDALTKQVSLEPSLQQASRAAGQLSENLKAAYNATTGKINLTQFNEELKKSGKTLEDYYNELTQLGVQGQSAFLKVSSAIMSAETPLKRTSALFDQLWITMKNTMRWQLTSSVLHGFVGSLETAYGYTKDLNRSLNEIRIVSGKSANDMAKFAEQANKAAKALSTTTTDYTDASLIYYQQGLSDEEVKEKTDLTIKMANVAGESADIVSDQLTAVWNNFYENGTQSLTHYADAMVALGAATASSTDEIAGGLEKFASIADMIGLSFDYASSALATITSVTRQSEDVVGTALKTIFARIQGLSLGETLEDGTDLNKYSKALDSVGISIKEDNGELKNMDNILDEMGDKWNTLSKDQQVALAQTVAGVRQYNQLVSLMDNWDFFKKNLAIAQGSEGELDRQAQVYAESWQAARDRVKAAAEDIYDSIINPDLFIGLDDMFTPTLTFIAKLIDGLGGLNGILSISVNLMTKMFGDKMSQAIRNVADNFTIMKNNSDQGTKSMAAKLAEYSFNDQIDAKERVTQEDKLAYQNIANQQQMAQLENKANDYSKNLTGYNAQILKNDIEQLKSAQLYVEGMFQRVEELEELASKQEERVTKLATAPNEDWRDRVHNSKPKGEKGQFISKDESVTNILNNQRINTTQKAMQAFEKQLQPTIAKYAQLQAVQNEYAKSGDQVTDKVAKMALEFKLLGKGFDKDIDGVRDWVTADDGMNESLTQTFNKISSLTTAMKELTNGQEESKKSVDNLVNSYNQVAQSQGNLKGSMEVVNESISKVNEKIEDGSLLKMRKSDQIVAMGDYLSSLAMNFNAVSSAIENLSNPDLTGLEKINTLISSLPMLVASYVSAFDIALKFMDKETKIYWLNTAAKVKNIAVTKLTALAETRLGVAILTAIPKIEAATLAIKAWAGPLLIIATIATTVIAAVNSLSQAAKEAREESIAQQKEQYQSTKEEIEANEELISSYRKALDTYKETGSNKAELNQATLDVADALNIENAAVINLTGDYEKLNKEIEKAERKEKERKLNNAVVNKSVYKEGISQDNAPLINGQYEKKNVNGHMMIETDSNLSDTAEVASDIVEIYEKALEKSEEMREAAAETGEDLADNKKYQQLVTWLGQNQEAYEQYIAVVEEANQAAFDLAVLDTNDIVPTENIDSYQEYLEYSQELNKQIDERVKKGEIEASAVDSLREKYLMGAEGLKKYALQEQLLNNLSDRFGTDPNSKEAIDFASKLSEKDLAIAITLVPKAGTLEDFGNQLEQAVTESLTEAAITSAQTIGSMLQKINENNVISSDNYKSLQEDSTFMEQMEQDFGTFEDFQKQARQVQIEYVRDYYNTISQFSVDNLGKQREQAEEEYAITLNKYNAYKELEEDHTQELERMADLRAQYATASSEQEKQQLETQWAGLQDWLSDQGFNIVFDIEDNEETIDTLDQKMLEIQDRIDEINDKEIELAVNWDDFDDLKGQMDSLGSFATTMQKDAEKVGNSYQYPIDSVRDWMEVYPDLFAQAKVTGQGLMSIDQDVVDNYIDTKQKEVQGNADAKIEIWKQEIQDLEATQTKLLAEKEALTAFNDSKIDINKLTNEQIATMAQQLTQYQIDCGVQADTAHAETLKSMGINENKYSEIVADVAKTNAQNMTNSSNKGANNTISAISKMSASIKNFAHNVKESFKAFIDPTYKPNYKSVLAAAAGNGGNYQGSDTTKDFTPVDATTVDPIKEFKKQDLERIDLAFEANNNAINNLKAKILAAQNIKEIDNAYEGTGGPDKSGKKGGSGGTPSKEDFKESLERYHEITREIKYQEKELDKLNTKIERTYGTKRLDLYAQKIKELTHLSELQKDKMLAAAANIEFDKQDIVDLGLKPQIDSETLEITNYTELLKQTQQAYKDYLNKYNAMTKEQQEAAQEDKDKAKERYDDRINALKQYEDSIDTYREQLEDFEDSLRQIEDTKLQVSIDKLGFAIDLKDIKNSFQDFSKTIAENFGDALTHGIDVAKISAEQAQLEADLWPNYLDHYNELQDQLANANKYTDTTAIQDELTELQNKIISSGKSIVEWANSIEDLIPDAVDAAAERFSAFTDQLDHNTSVLDTIKELYALQGITYKTADGFNRLQKNSQEKLEAQVASAQLQRGWYEEANERLKEAQAKLDSLNGDETDIRYDTYKKARDAYLAEFNDAQEAYLSSAKDAMETAQEMYLQQIEKAAYAFGQAVSDNVGLDLLQDKYDHYIETEERYFDKVNEAYQVSAWYNKLQKDIDDTTNVAYKNRLKALQEEIDQRKEGNKLSQYDLDILNAKYQVLQAQQALEEAQNNKNKLQLVRDSQGNWNYQFTADEDAIANAEQDVLDAQNNWYNIAKDRTKEVAGEIVSMWQDCTDAVEQLYKDLANGDITEEEYLKKKAEIEEYYTEKAKYLEEEKNEAIKDMNEAGYEALKEIAEKNGETVEDFKNVYADELNSMTYSNKNFADYLNDYLDQCKKGFDDYQDTVSNVAGKTGTDLDNLAQETDKVSKATDELRDKGLEAKDSLWEMVDATSNLIEEQLSLADALQDVIDKMRTMASLAGKTGASNGYDKNTDYSDVIRDGLANGWLQYRSDEYNELVKQRNTKIKDLNLGQYDMSDEDFKNSTGSGAYTDRDAWLKKMRELGVTGFATGGYTGSFDDEKLAFLHQKELVLNQEDTANILTAVQTVRTIGADLFKSIEKALDGNAIAAMALVSQRLNPVTGTQVQGAIEQTVHIDKVEFPNVTSRTEIEEAFVSLTNDAAQWAKRRTQ